MAPASNAIPAAAPAAAAEKAAVGATGSRERAAPLPRASLSASAPAAAADRRSLLSLLQPLIPARPLAASQRCEPVEAVVPQIIFDRRSAMRWSSRRCRASAPLRSHYH